MEAENTNIVTFNFSYTLERAESAIKSKKFIIAVNHYYNILSKGVEVAEKEKLNEVGTCFYFSTFFLSAGPIKDKMINFSLKNDFLVISQYLYQLLLDISKGKLILENDYKDINKYAPELIRNLLSTNPELTRESFLEHNVNSISNYYENISFNSLDKFLDLKNSENQIFKLIIEGKVRAKIDQTKEIIIFIKEETLPYNKMIQNFCSRLVCINEQFSKDV